MDHYSIPRRGYLGATGVLLTGGALAGCINSSAAADLANANAFNVDAAFALYGDGPGEPVTVNLVVDGNEFERTFMPGEEFEAELESPYGEVELELEYEEKVKAELEWSRPGIELDVDIEQAQWDYTAGNVEISFANGELTTAFDATLTLPESSTEITGTDTRTVRAETAYEIDIDLSVEDDEVEGEFEVAWEADEPDHADDDSDDADHIEDDDDE